MARECAKCNRVLRWDETLSVLHVEGLGIFSACPDCHAEATGQEPQAPRCYRRGERVPRHAYGDGDMPICGLCRRALFEDERIPPTPMRLQSEDVADEPDFAFVLDNDCFASCRECLARFTPKIAKRLRRMGIIAETTPDRSVRGNMLL